MESSSIKIIDCFNITGIGLLTEIQHHLDGIPPNTQIIDPETNEIWLIKKRILHGILILNKSEEYFDCETESIQVDCVFKTISKRESAVKKELNKRENGIYSYLLKPSNKKQNIKPKTGSVLNIKK